MQFSDARDGTKMKIYFWLYGQSMALEGLETIPNSWETKQIFSYIVI